MGKKRKLGVLSCLLARTLCAVGLAAILVSCGDSSYSGGGYRYTIGGTVNGLTGSGLVLLNIGVESLSITASGPFRFHTSVANGESYTVAVGPDPIVLPTQTCIVSSGGSGTIDASPVNNIVVNCVTPPHYVTVDPSGQFAYKPNYTLNTISAYTINSSTGALTLVEREPTGTNPTSFTIDPSGQFAYAVNHNSDSISVYTINPSDGSLTLVETEPTGMNPFSMTIEPGGNFAYVVNMGDNTVSAYTINSSTGALTNVTGSSFPTEMYPTSVTIANPPGKLFAYVVNNSSNTISVYEIDQTTTPGALIPLGTIATGSNPFFITIANPPGKYFAYVANYNSANISVYEINPATGALTAGTTVAAGTKPLLVTVDPLGQFAYAADIRSDNISAYTIDPATGALTNVTGSPFATGTNTNPISVTIANSPGKLFAYTANYTSDNISAYEIDQTTTPGALIAIAGNPFAAGTNPNFVTIANPPGKFFAYAANSGSSDISVYEIDQITTPGALMPVETESY